MIPVNNRKRRKRIELDGNIQRISENDATYHDTRYPPFGYWNYQLIHETK